MSIETMKQALDWMEWFAGDDHSIRPKSKAFEIVQALRQAIEQAQKQEQKVDWEKLYRLEVKKKEALAAKYERDIKPLTRIIPMAQKQEPVACVQDLDEVKRKHLVYEKGMDWKDPLYTTPPQRQWTDLTKEECFELCVKHKDEPFSLLVAVQAKLKEKNGL